MGRISDIFPESALQIESGSLADSSSSEQAPMTSPTSNKMLLWDSFGSGNDLVFAFLKSSNGLNSSYVELISLGKSNCNLQFHPLSVSFPRIPSRFVKSLHLWSNCG